MTSNDKLEAILAQRSRAVALRPGCKHCKDVACDPDRDMCADERIRRLVAEFLRARTGLLTR